MGSELNSNQKIEDIELFCKGLDPLKEYYKEFLELIKISVEKGLPIIVRHDNDVDGYTSGLSLERALKTKYPKHDIRRKISRTPYANLEDANEDSKNNSLVIILDNGSSEDNLDALKRMKAFDIKIGVIDHHMLHEECIKFSDVHLNPRRKGLNHHITSGMLTFELARLISGFNNLTFPTVAGYDDRSICDEWLCYKELDEKRIQDIDNALNYELKKARGGSTESLWAILDIKNKKHELIVNANLDSYNKIKLETLPKLKKCIKKEGNIYFVEIEGLSKDMPNPGMLLQWALEIIYPKSREYYIKNGQEEFFVYGILDNQVMLRNTCNRDFDELIILLKEKFNVSGGGHQDRASIRFKEEKEKIIKEIIEWSTIHQE